MDLTVTREHWGREDQRWLASKHAVDTARSGTIPRASLDPVKHHPEGYLPSGLPLAQRADGAWIPYDSANQGEAGILGGFLLATVTVKPGSTGDVTVAVLRHAFVKRAFLPAPIPEQPKSTGLFLFE